MRDTYSNRIAQSQRTQHKILWSIVLARSRLFPVRSGRFAAADEREAAPSSGLPPLDSISMWVALLTWAAASCPCHICARMSATSPARIRRARRHNPSVCFIQRPSRRFAARAKWDVGTNDGQNTKTRNNTVSDNDLTSEYAACTGGASDADYEDENFAIIASALGAQSQMGKGRDQCPYLVVAVVESGDTTGEVPLPARRWQAPAMIAHAATAGRTRSVGARSTASNEQRTWVSALTSRLRMRAGEEKQQNRLAVDYKQAPNQTRPSIITREGEDAKDATAQARERGWATAAIKAGKPEGADQKGQRCERGFRCWDAEQAVDQRNHCDRIYEIRTHECQADNGAPALALAANGRTTCRACS